MRFRTAFLLAGALLITSIEVPQADSAQDTPDQSVVRLRLIRDIAEEHGTAVLIRRDDHGSETVLYFLTSSRLFRSVRGDRRAAPVIELLLEGQHPLAVTRGDVSMASGGCVDIAVFRVRPPAPTALVAQRVVYDGRHGLPKFFLGSVAERMVVTAPCPVVTVRPT